MNNKNYSGKDTVPFKVNPFKINSSRKEKKKKKPHLRYFPTPIFLVPSVRKFVEKEKKKGAGGESETRSSRS